jgi:SAM-dependent methyltransferase
MPEKKLTEQNYWEKYWETRSEAAVEIKRTSQGLSVNSILDVFDKYLPVNENFHALEIGGAPGQYLIYMHKKFRYHVHSLDYSKIGNEQTIKNLKAAGIEVNVYEKDLFVENFAQDLPKFDIVYSLGFIEHFENLNEVVKRHVDLLKPGGVLLLGVPNLRGIYKFFLKQTAPSHLSIHNLNTMDVANWSGFEKEFGLKVIFKNYVSGFEPLVMKKLEIRNPWTLFLNLIVKILMVIFSFNFSFLRKVNSKCWSGYLIGVYRKN